MSSSADMIPCSSTDNVPTPASDNAPATSSSASSPNPTESSNKFILISSDDVSFPVSPELVKHSEMIREAISVCGTDQAFPLSRIDSKTLQHVLNIFQMWINDSEEYEKPMHGGRGMGPEPDCKEFEYLRKLENEELYAVCRAGGYLLSQRFVDLTCFFVHEKMKNLSTEAMCDFFGEQYDPNYKPTPSSETA